MVEAEIKKREHLYNTIIESSIDGILVLESVRDNNGVIVDFKISHCNKTGCQLAQFPDDAAGKTLLTVLPHLSGAGQFAMHKHVVETGEPIRFETTFRNDKGEEYGWFIVFLQKLEDGVLSRFIDITEKKNNEEKIEKQANLLHSILEASQHSVVALKAVKNSEDKIIDFVFLTVNTRFAEMLGLSNMEIVGKSYNEFLANVGQPGMFDIKCNVMLTGIPYKGEVYYNYQNVETWFNVSITRLGSDGVVQTIVDITESKKAKNRLSKIINTSGAGVTTLLPVKNASGELTDFTFDIVNDSMRSFFKIADTCLTGNLVSSYFSFFGKTKMFEVLKETYLNNKTHSFEFYIEDYDMYFNIRADKMEDELLVTFIDQTPLKKMQLSLQKSIVDLRRSNDSLEAFTTAASHDLKEPIRKINLLLGHLKLRYLKENKTESFDTFEKMELAIKRMLSLIDDLLEYSHLSHEIPEFKVVDLNAKLKRITEDLDLLIEEKKAVIEVGALPVIKGHRRQMHQLFQNIINNSLKYGKPGIEPEIKITAQLKPGSQIGIVLADDQLNKMYHVIEISDNGIGFEQAYAEKIFEVFERLNSKYESKGSGVGLAIARKVVENHNGYIKATSAPGEGATFTIFLPVES